MRECLQETLALLAKSADRIQVLLNDDAGAERAARVETDKPAINGVNGHGI